MEREDKRKKEEGAHLRTPLYRLGRWLNGEEGLLTVQTKDLDLNPQNLYKSQAPLCVLESQGYGERETERPWDLSDPV